MTDVAALAAQVAIDRLNAAVEARDALQAEVDAFRAEQAARAQNAEHDHDWRRDPFFSATAPGGQPYARLACAVCSQVIVVVSSASPYSVESWPKA